MVYLDLGMSSMQVDTRERGFSYAYDAPLDMRMDPAQELTAAEIVNTWEQRRLARVLRDYGEERYADRIAREIVRRRAGASSARRSSSSTPSPPRSRRPARFAGGHPAKRTFQGIRIAVNDELGQLDAALPLAWDLLARGRPPRRDLLPLARGPARQALPGRAHPRLHLPARPAGVRLRPHAAGRARVPPLRRRRRRARWPTTRAPGPPACARRASSSTRRSGHDAGDRTLAPQVVASCRASRGASPARCAPRAASRRRAGGATASVVTRARAARRPSPARPPAAQPRLDLGAGHPARGHRRDAGLAAQAELGHLARRGDDGDARAPERRARERDRPPGRHRPGSRRGRSRSAS